MNAQEAIDFLKAHQPMPSEERRHNDLFSRLEEVRKYFASCPDDRSVHLFIGALGPGDGNGIYPMIEDVLRAHSPDIVMAELKVGLRSLHPSVRYWSAQFAAGYPNADIAEDLISAFLIGDVDTQLAVITAIEAIDSPATRKLLIDVRENSLDQEVTDLIDEVTWKTDL
jgi:hypothetical protein